jgi:pyridoxamine 5'-phosphate oxidase family protein
MLGSPGSPGSLGSGRMKVASITRFHAGDCHSHPARRSRPVPRNQRVPVSDRQWIMSFTAEEVAFIQSQRLVRVATTSSDGQPDVVPTGFEFDGTHFYIGGFDTTNTRRTRNVRSGNNKVAFVLDDLASTDPWTPRFLRVYGTAELVERDGQPILKITPVTSWSFNLAGIALDDARSSGLRRTVH